MTPTGASEDRTGPEVVPTKRLYSNAGLVFLSDFFDWTAAEAYIFRSNVHHRGCVRNGKVLSHFRGQGEPP